MRARHGILLIVALIAALAAPAAAWGPGGHAVVLTGVAKARGASAPSRYLYLQAVYGAIAPDLAWQASEPLRTNLATATHDEPGYREPWDRARPGVAAERAFALGWISHNQAWGADYYAHLGNPFLGTWPAAGPGYVVERAGVLAARCGVSEEVAHDYIEVAVDLLLDQQHPEWGLGELLQNSASSRDWRLPGLLANSYADVPGANWLSIRTLESAFRLGSSVYAGTLALPTGQDDATFSTAMAVLYGLSPSESASCLAEAKAVCQEQEAHYEDALAATVALVASGPQP